MLIYGYAYVRPYATAYNGMQRHTNDCGIFTTWHNCNVTFLQRICQAEISYAKIDIGMR